MEYNNSNKSVEITDGSHVVLATRVPHVTNFKSYEVENS